METKIPPSLTRFHKSMVNVYTFTIPEDQSISKVLSDWARVLEERNQEIDKILSDNRTYNILLKQPRLESVGDVADRATKNFSPMECIGMMLNGTQAVQATRDHFIDILAELVLRYINESKILGRMPTMSKFHFPSLMTQRCIDGYINGKMMSVDALMAEMIKRGYDSDKVYIDSITNGTYLLKWYKPEIENIERWTKQFCTERRTDPLVMAEVAFTLANYILHPELMDKEYAEALPSDFLPVTLIICADALRDMRSKGIKK